MYQSHWGLQESPFLGQRNPRFFYQSPTHEEALARLHFLVEERRRLGLLVGAAGCGKSLLLEVFAEQLREMACPTASVSLVGIGPCELLSLLASCFDLNLASNLSQGALWRAVCDRLAEYRFQQTATAILLDDADEADSRTLDQVLRLVQHENSPEARLTLVLAGRPERLGRIGSRLLELAELRIDVAEFEQSDTADFVRHSLAEAGREAEIFDPAALERLHALAHGVPRRVSQLADLALLAGAGENLPSIDAGMVDSVYHELGVVRV